MGLFNLPVLQQPPQASPIPPQPATATGAPAAPIAFQPGQAVGFFTDSTLCIGCKACEVACKQWNQLPAIDGGANQLTGNSYDNTGQLDGMNWRHVKFIEQFNADRTQAKWLMLSDVCKHCVQAGCLEVCPTGAIVRTEFDTVYVQPDICNGCGYCVVGCPFGVIDRREDDGRAWKCTLCYDRLKMDLEPACAKACPTDSIIFGELDELHIKAETRLKQLHAEGVSEARLYGPELDGVDGTNAIFLLVDEPEVYNLPPAPVVPQKTQADAWRSVAVGAAAMALLAVGTILSARGRR
jgi:formate dehydrogenase iron-sulfur subunit